jgi:transposase
MAADAEGESDVLVLERGPEVDPGVDLLGERQALAADELDGDTTGEDAPADGAVDVGAPEVSAAPEINEPSAVESPASALPSTDGRAQGAELVDKAEAIAETASLAIGQNLDPNASDHLQATASFFDHGPGDRIPEENFPGTISPDHFRHLVPGEADREDDCVLEQKVARKDFVEFAVNELGQGLEDSREYKAANKLRKPVFLRIFRNLSEAQQRDRFYFAHAGERCPTVAQRRAMRHSWMEDLLRFSGLSLKQIADRVGVDEKTVRNVRDKMPDFADRIFPGANRSRRGENLEALVEQARQLRDEGHSLEAIATKMDKSVSTISRWVNKPRTPDSKGKPLADPGDVLSDSPSRAPIAETVNSTATSFASTSSTPDGPTGTRTIPTSDAQSASPDSNSVHKAIDRASRLFDEIEGSLAPEDRRLFLVGIRECVGTRLGRLSDTESNANTADEQPASTENSSSENEQESSP